MPERTWYNWVEEGKRQVLEDEEPGSLGLFWQLVQEAKARVIAQRLGRIEEAGKKGTWQADAWYLERTEPGLYSKRFEAKIEQRSESVNVTAQLSEGTLGKLMALAAEELRPALSAPSEE